MFAHCNRSLVSVAFVLAVGIGTTGAGCDHARPKAWVEESQLIELSAADISALRAITDNGRVRVRGTNAASNAIEATAHMRAGGASDEDAQAALDAIEIVTTVEDNGVQVLRWDWPEDRPRDWAAEVSFEVTVPAHLSVTIETENGEIDVLGVAGDLRLASANGRITLDNEAALNIGEPDIQAETQNGEIRARCQASRLELTTQNGRIDARTSAEKLHLQSSNGMVTVGLTDAGPVGGSIQTENGSVRLEIADGVSTELECRTMNGQIRSKIELADQDRKRLYLRGRLGSGGGELKLETSNGSIEIAPLDAATPNESDESEVSL